MMTSSPPSRWMAALAILSSLASAQTFTSCNPLKTTCPPDPAYGAETVNCAFDKGPCSAVKPLAGTQIEYGGKGAVFSISRDDQAPTVATGKYIFFGRVDVSLQAAPGRGIVTSVVLQSDDLDEIDWEWLGGDNSQVQTNYFSKGDTSTYDRGQFHSVSNPIGSSHLYTIEWNSKGVTWLIDGKVVRNLTAQNAKGGASKLPQTPMQVKLGTWVAGRQGGNPGTVQWAGGYADYSAAPFKAYYQMVSVIDYAGKDRMTSRAIKEYVYGDRSGSWQSIRIQ